MGNTVRNSKFGSSGWLTSWPWVASLHVLFPFFQSDLCLLHLLLALSLLPMYQQLSCSVHMIKYIMFLEMHVMCLSSFHFRPSQGDLKYLVFAGVCLHMSHLSHLKYPFSSSGPFLGNLLGRVGLIISAMFFNLLLHGIMEALGNTFLQAGSEYRISLNSCIILPFEGILGSHLVLQADIDFLLVFFSPNSSSLLFNCFAFRNSFLVLSWFHPLQANWFILSSIVLSNPSSVLQLDTNSQPQTLE